MTDKKDKKSKLVFIVEDNIMYAKSLQKYLGDRLPEGSKIEIFQVGELAVDKLHLKPDFIVMDYFLNSKFHDAADGLEMIREIREQNKNVKIIVLSSQDNLEVAIRAMEQTQGKYIIKNDDAFQKVADFINAG
jgi:DNA-binding NarL/FixJ family response regulator